MTETLARRAHRRPPLVLLAGVHAVLFIASLAVLNDNTGLIRVVGMLQFGPAVPGAWSPPASPLPGTRRSPSWTYYLVR